MSLDGAIWWSLRFVEYVQVNHILIILTKQYCAIVLDLYLFQASMVYISFPNSQIYVSAEHKIGILDLKTEINSQLSNKTNNLINYDTDHSVAIVGKPNTGKSTLLNNLIGKKVSITGSMPHLTRDPVETRLLWEKVNFKIFDTAGIVNQSKKIRKNLGN